jgi:hypothetical protein
MVIFLYNTRVSRMTGNLLAKAYQAHGFRPVPLGLKLPCTHNGSNPLQHTCEYDDGKFACPRAYKAMTKTENRDAQRMHAQYWLEKKDE